MALLETGGLTERYGSVVAVDEGSAPRARRGYMPEHDCLLPDVSATALVHDPEVLPLDEPFNGMDPRLRLQMTRVLAGLSEVGRTVLFSSHILEEVEALSTSVQVVVAGRHAASGDLHAIRAVKTSRPHRCTVRSSDDRALAAALITDPSTTSVGTTTSACTRSGPTTPRWRASSGTSSTRVARDDRWSAMKRGSP